MSPTDVRRLKSELAARWGEAPLAKLREQIFRRWAAGKDLAPLGLPSHDGKLDLRGLTAPEPEVSRSFTVGIRDRLFKVDRMRGLTELRAGELVDADLSYADLSSVRFFDARIERCLFRSARLKEAGFWGCEVADTSFGGADLTSAVLGGDDPKPTVYRSVDFRRANLTDADPGFTDFLDCDFSGARLERVEFYGCRIERCTFAGPMREVIISAVPFRPGVRPGVLEDVNFAEASFQLCGIRGFDLDRVMLPQSDEHVRFTKFPCVLRRAIDGLDRKPDDENARWLKGLLEDQLDWLGPNQRIGVLAVRDLHPSGTLEAGRPIAEWLARLDSECG